MTRAPLRTLCTRIPSGSRRPEHQQQGWLPYPQLRWADGRRFRLACMRKRCQCEKNGYDLAANYNIGALNLGAGYSQVDSNRQLGLRALYTFGQFVVGGYYQRNKDDNQLLATGAGNPQQLPPGGRLHDGCFRVPRERGPRWQVERHCRQLRYAVDPGLQLQLQQAHQRRCTLSTRRWTTRQVLPT